MVGVLWRLSLDVMGWSLIVVFPGHMCLFYFELSFLLVFVNQPLFVKPDNSMSDP